MLFVCYFFLLTSYKSVKIMENIKETIEGLLFVCSDGITIQEIKNKLSIATKDVHKHIKSLIEEYEKKDGGLLSVKLEMSTNLLRIPGFMKI